MDVVPIEDLDSCIDAAIEKINAGVAALRARGIQAELPSEVKFSMVVVKRWQALEVAAVQTQQATDTSTKESTGERKTYEENAHDQQTEEKLYSTIT